MAATGNRTNFSGQRRGANRLQDAGASVRGAEQLLALSKAMKAAGDTQLRKEFHKALGQGAKPIIPKVKAAAEAKLPKKNGLNKRIAKKPLRAQTRTGASTAGVRIVGSKVDPRINSQGRVYHPVFGRKPGVAQNVYAAQGYFSNTILAEGPEVRDEILNVLRDYTARFASQNRTT